jgi:hypothetical protein
MTLNFLCFGVNNSAVKGMFFAQFGRKLRPHNLITLADTHL